MKPTTDHGPGKPEEKDPILEGSLSWPMAIVTLCLILSTSWATYDEFIGRRPWKALQAAFVPAYRQHLEQVRDLQSEKEKAIEASDEYQQRKPAADAVSDRIRAEKESLGAEIALAGRQLEAITTQLKEARSYTAAMTYKIETASTEENKQRLQDRLSRYHEGPFVVDWPDVDGGTTAKTYNYGDLLGAFNEVQEKRSKLRRKLGELVQQEAEKRRAVSAFVDQRLDGPTRASVEAQIAALDTFQYGITSHQIYLEEAGLADRCEVCHLAIRSPVAVTAKDIRNASGSITEEMANAFTSHPKIRLSEGDLLEVHSPDKFGCSPCHGGNGRALVSAKEAHGHYHHWLWPRYDKENTEAGCVQCHQGALYLEGAETLNRGRDLFFRLGCWGCHPRDGYGMEALALKNIAQEMRSIESQRHHLNRLNEQLDAAYENKDAEVDPEVIQQKRSAIQQQFSQLDTDWDQAALRKTSLQRARKNPGPDLTDVRAKLKKEWIPAWLTDPREFRPTTRMPRFDLSEDQVRAISAFIWQAAEEKKVPHFEPGDRQRGKGLFETRGCQACHLLEGQPSFASNLDRLNEKANYDYLVEWILNPREGAMMPDLRLDEQEARDVASYLTGQETSVKYKPADYLTDRSLFEEGKDLVRHFGCFGCHEIAGTENFSRIGTDLTEEGSKPIERLDFGLLTHEAKRQGWHTHKGFLDRKLADPRRFDQGKLFDQGKVQRPWHERLKMPDFGLKDRPDDRRALVTFLLGSIDSQIPEYLHHDPSDRAKDVEAGWWVAKKYHCTGCHQIVPGETPDIWKLPQYQGEEGRATAPPSLVGTGARLEADWLIKFLRNPALGETKLHRNGARMYLGIRMPTYKISEQEIGQLVRFLNALSKQPSPYPFEKLLPLNADELADARAIFQKSRCLSCHVASDDPSTFTSETKAPSYVVSAERLKPRWMRHWMLNPRKIMPGTVMPADLFKEVAGRWKARFLPEEGVRVKDADHLELLVRYQKFFDKNEAEYWRRRQESKQ